MLLMACLSRSAPSARQTPSPPSHDPRTPSQSRPLEANSYQTEKPPPRGWVGGSIPVFSTLMKASTGMSTLRKPVSNRVESGEMASGRLVSMKRYTGVERRIDEVRALWKMTGEQGSREA